MGEISQQQQQQVLRECVSRSACSSLWLFVRRACVGVVGSSERARRGRSHDARENQKTGKYTAPSFLHEIPIASPRATLAAANPPLRSIDRFFSFPLHTRSRSALVCCSRSSACFLSSCSLRCGVVSAIQCCETRARGTVGHEGRTERLDSARLVSARVRVRHGYRDRST